jgi:hypothetical protein
VAEKVICASDKGGEACTTPAEIPPVEDALVSPESETLLVVALKSTARIAC